MTSLAHSFNKYLLSAYFVLGTRRGCGRAFGEQEELCLAVSCILREVAFCPRPHWEAFVSGDLRFQESGSVPLPWLTFPWAPDLRWRHLERVEGWWAPSSPGVSPSGGLSASETPLDHPVTRHS